MMQTILSDAIQAIQNGRMIIYPTDTIYGLGVDIFNDEAVYNLYRLKQRPYDQPISVAVSSIDDIEKIAEVDDRIRILVEKLLPGKLTIILTKKSLVSDIVTAGLEKIAVRIPDCEVTHRLLDLVGPITCTSANIHGDAIPSDPEDIMMQFEPEDIDVFIDMGKLDGKPSTIVDMTGEEPVIVREGVISLEMILDAINNDE